MKDTAALFFEYEIAEKNEIRGNSETSPNENSNSTELKLYDKKLQENNDEKFLPPYQIKEKNRMRATTEMSTNENSKAIEEVIGEDYSVEDEFEEKYKFMFKDKDSNIFFSNEKKYNNNENEKLKMIVLIDEKEKKQNNINSINNSNNESVNKLLFNSNLFNVINKKRGRCAKHRGNNIAKHTNASCDDCYKKIIHKSIDSAVKDINHIIKKEKIKIHKLNKITGIEKNYDLNLLNQPIKNILMNYRRVVTKNEKEENSKIIEFIKSKENIKKILEMEFHVYIDEYAKKEIKNIKDEKETKTWSLIIEKGIYDFCSNRKLRKKRKKN